MKIGVRMLGLFVLIGAGAACNSVRVAPIDDEDGGSSESSDTGGSTDSGSSPDSGDSGDSGDGGRAAAEDADANDVQCLLDASVDR